MRTKSNKPKVNYPTDLEGNEIIQSPMPGTIVEHDGWSPNGKLKGYPCDVLILKGSYEGEYGRISNFWWWKRIIISKSGTVALGPEEYGYGAFHPSENKYEIEIKIKLLKK